MRTDRDEKHEKNLLRKTKTILRKSMNFFNHDPSRKIGSPSKNEGHEGRKNREHAKKTF